MDGAPSDRSPSGTGYSKAYLFYVLALLFATVALNVSDRTLFAVLIPQMKAEIGASDATMGALGGPAFALSYVLFSLPLAMLADRWSRRKVLALSVLTFSVMTAFCGMAANLGQLALARIGVGIGESGTTPPSQSIVASIFSMRLRSTALGVMSAGIYAGVLFGTAAAGHLTAVVGWRQTFILLGVPGMLIGCLAWTTLPRRPTAAGMAKKPVGEALRICFRSQSLILITLASGIGNIAGVAMQIWLPSFLARSHGMLIQEAATWIGVAAVLGCGRNIGRGPPR